MCVYPHVNITVKPSEQLFPLFSLLNTLKTDVPHDNTSVSSALTNLKDR